PGGILFLGKSEALGQSKAFFTPLDSSARIFQRRDREVDPNLNFAKQPSRKYESEAPSSLQANALESGIFTEVIRWLAPNSILLDADFKVLEVFGEAGQCLHIRAGIMRTGIEGLLKEEVRSKLLALLHRARRDGRIASAMPMSWQGTPG